LVAEELLLMCGRGSHSGSPDVGFGLGFGKNALRAWRIGLVPYRDVDSEDKGAMVSHNEAVIMRHTNGCGCENGASIKDMINSADGGVVDAKKGRFRWEVEDMIGITEVKWRGPFQKACK